MGRGGRDDIFVSREIDGLRMTGRVIVIQLKSVYSQYCMISMGKEGVAMLAAAKVACSSHYHTTMGN